MNFKLLNFEITIPFDFVNKFHLRIEWNHSQTLERLNERGGLSPCELLAGIQNKTLAEILKNNCNEIEALSEIFKNLVKWLKEKEK